MRASWRRHLRRRRPAALVRTDRNNARNLGSLMNFRDPHHAARRADTDRYCKPITLRPRARPAQALAAMAARACCEQSERSRTTARQAQARAKNRETKGTGRPLELRSRTACAVAACLPCRNRRIPARRNHARTHQLEGRAGSSPLKMSCCGVRNDTARANDARAE